VSELSERDLIARIQQQLAPAPPWLLVGIGDDAAVVEPERNRLEVLSVDAIVEGVHFERRYVPPAAIGHRALAVNLSDLAAMGAVPRLALLSFALPSALSCRDFDAIVSGLTALAKRHRLHVVGGNLTRTPGPMVIDVTVSGSVKRRQVLARSGARAGDEIYVTGSVGAAAAGREQLADGAGGAAGDNAARFLYPEPRVRTGLLLGRNRAATAAIDLSDGVADGVRRLSEAGGVGAIIDAGALPIGEETRTWFAARGLDPVTESLSGGDDYELLFTVRPRLRHRLRSVAQGSDVPLTRIGVCTRETAVVLRRIAGDPSSDTPLPGGYTHFR
jgi:thiamine-monophosphate kinase